MIAGQLVEHLSISYSIVYPVNCACGGWAGSDTNQFGLAISLKTIYLFDADIESNLNSHLILL